MLSAGRPISEILVALKRFGPSYNISHAELGSDKQSCDIACEVRRFSPQWEVVKVVGEPFAQQVDFAPDGSRSRLPLPIESGGFGTAQPISPIEHEKSQLADHQESFGALAPGTVDNGPHSLVTLEVQRSGDRSGSGVRL